LVFIVPIGLLSWQYFGDKTAAIDFVKNERDGVATLELLAPVLHGAVDASNATRAMAGGFDASATYAEARKQTEQALTKLTAEVTRQDDPLKLKAALEKLQQAWAQTASSKNGLDTKGLSVYGPVSAATLELLQLIGDNSALVLDPDIDSFYTINALVLNLPGAIENVGQLWGWGTYALAHGGIGDEQERNWITWDTGVNNGLHEITRSFERAIAANPDLKARFDLTGLEKVASLRKAGHTAVFSLDGGSPGPYFKQGQDSTAAVAQLFEIALPVLDDLLAAREHHLVQVRNLTLFVLVFSLALATYLFLCFRKVLEGGLNEVAFHINSMRDGDLTTTPRAWGGDEAARLMSTILEMQASLRRIVSRVRQASDNIVHASSEIAAASIDLSGRTEQSAANLQQQASTLAQITNTVQGTADVAEEASGIATNNADVAERGGQIMSSVVTTMQGIQEASHRIGDIIGTIDGIAFQTNILALNAAVEAARAGESGRGFAVVATEVRALAQRSSTAAREIKALIDDSVNRVESGTVVVKDAGTTIDKIVEEARRVNDLLASIASSAKEEAEGVRQTTSAVHAMDAATQQNAALVEETAAAASSLRDQAVGLAGEVAAFKLG
jgi:methyl-accepting chemotaxis protein